MGAEWHPVKSFGKFLSAQTLRVKGLAPVAFIPYTRTMTTNTLHAHVSTAASDCDGPVYRSYVQTMSKEQQADDFGDLHFKADVLSSHVSFHSEGGVTVKVEAWGFTMDEPTDEGYRSASVRWCEDKCDETKTSYRDVFAEQMGY